MKLDDDQLYCYLGGDFLRKAIESDKVLDALLDQLDVPGKPGQLRALSPRDKLKAIEQQIENLRKTETSIWRDVPAPEVLAASIYRCSRLSNRYVLNLFGDARTEAELLEPVAGWIEDQGLVPYDEVPLGRGRADVVGFRKAGLLKSARVVAVELKNDLDQLKRGLDQMTTFSEYSHATYLACVPALAAEFLDSHAEGRGVRRWDADVLTRKVESFGFGLLLVEGDDVSEIVEPKPHAVAKDKLAEVVAHLATREPV